MRHLKVKRNECGSPPAPRKGSTWNGNQPLSRATKYILKATSRKKLVDRFFMPCHNHN
ncbi:hypothetical protein QUF49_12570 [Fictibacillus sp. b24]|uniref:hypothetical protein n=1 Tax=Fictibacillus sp. b24 TaxID=3055863 RepID=UPI0025A0396E|nr:hypothetical protein [Fictibacillus sp. b24]MDM5316832.1 hypothetical protein [Fictibacillus sp. b24]